MAAGFRSLADSIWSAIATKGVNKERICVAVDRVRRLFCFSACFCTAVSDRPFQAQIVFVKSSYSGRPLVPIRNLEPTFIRGTHRES